MKILIPIHGFGREGGYRVLSEFANAWTKRNHDVVFLCPDCSDEPYFPTIAKILWVDGAGNISDKRYIKVNPGRRYPIQALYRGINAIGCLYDVIFANQWMTAWSVALASGGKAKKIYYVQAYEPVFYTQNRTLKGYILALLAALSYHLPLKRIVNSPMYFRYRNLRASAFVPPGIDLSLFRPAPAIKDLTTAENIVIGCIGRREPIKGIKYVLRAFEEINKHDKRFVLRVAYGNLPEGWKHEQCEVVVPRNDKELADYYRSLDVLVAPGTVQHGAPHYPVLESGACGVAVVTTGFMGATPKTAWIVRNKDAASIAQGIVTAVSDDGQRIKKRELFLIEMQRYSWSNVSDEMIALMEHSTL